MQYEQYIYFLQHLFNHNYSVFVLVNRALADTSFDFKECISKF